MNKEFQQRDISFVVTDISENGEFEGYISTYYDVDSYGTYFLPGAWDRSIERFNAGEVIPVLWSHEDPMIKDCGRMVNSQWKTHKQKQLMHT